MKNIWTFGAALLAGMSLAACASQDVPGGASESTRGTDTIFPPYPTKWDWHVDEANGPVGLLNFRGMADGDVLISTYTSTGRHIAYFSGAEFKTVEDAFHGRYVSPDDRYDIEQTAQRRVISAISNPECLRGLGSGIRIYETQTDISRRTTFVWILDAPRQRPAVDCEMQKRPGFRSAVVLLQTDKLFPLSDGTLLIADRDVGVVVRVRVLADQRLCSDSALLGTKLFLVDTQWLLEKRQQFLEQHKDELLESWAPFFAELRSYLTSTERDIGKCSTDT